MKIKLKNSLLAASLLTLSAAANAGPGMLIGVSYNFGGDVGFTLKATSSDKQDAVIGAVGISYFPFSKERKIGLDASGGYNFESVAATVGYDFLLRKAQVAAGYANTKAPATVASPLAPTPPVAPIP